MAEVALVERKTTEEIERKREGFRPFLSANAGKSPASLGSTVNYVVLACRDPQPTGPAARIARFGLALRLHGVQPGESRWADPPDSSQPGAESLRGTWVLD